MHKTISVYFSGTGFSINNPHFLTASLHQNTKENESQIKMGFSGCGVDYGFRGTIFGSGLDEQCAKVSTRVLQELNAGHQVTLNVYGHSRGGIAALLLAKQLGNLDQEKLAINLALLDPVPGNLITTATLDPFKISLANKTMDLSDCKPLKKVLALYPYRPLPAIACHAPLLVSYPKETEVDIEIVNGCHAQAEQLHHPASHLVQLRVEEFLVQNGTHLQTTRDYKNVETMKQTYLDRYQQELPYVDQGMSRDTHSAQGMVIRAKTGAKYLNSRHKALAGDKSQEASALTLQPQSGFVAGFKRFLTNHPLIIQTAKWSAISLAVTGLLLATGGLAAIPLLAPLVAKLGALSLLAFSPIIGGAVASLWYGVTKPLLSWCASKFFYPHYSMHKMETGKADTADSTSKLIDTLGVDHHQAHSPTVDLAPYQSNSPLHAVSKTVREESKQDNEDRNTLCFN